MRFVVIAATRTGSSHFISLLGGHPDVLVNGNVFDARDENALYVFWPGNEPTRDLKRELIALRRADPEAFLEEIFSTNFGRAHTGFKIFEDENNDILDRLLDDPVIGKIVLYRRNVLARFSSALIARETKKYSRREWQKVGESPKVAFAERAFVKYQRKYVKFYEAIVDRLNESGQAFYFLNYEDINEPRCMLNVINFIGADCRKEMSRSAQARQLVKQNSPDILSRFSNPGDVVSFLEKHDLLHWMHEGELSLRPVRFLKEDRGEGADTPA